MRTLIAWLLLAVGAWGAEPGVLVPYRMPLLSGQPAQAVNLPGQQPGQYWVVVATPDGQMLSVWTLRSGWEGPDPNPVPPPPPPPPPPEQATWMIVVEESSERTAAQAAILANVAIRGLLPNRQFLVVDDDAVDRGGDVPDTVKQWIDKSEGKNLPWVFLADDEGLIAWQGPLPADVTATKALIAKHIKAPEGKRWECGQDGCQLVPDTKGDG